MAGRRRSLVLVCLTLMLLGNPSCAEDKRSEPMFEGQPRTRNHDYHDLAPLFDAIKIFLNDILVRDTLGDLIEEYNIATFSDFTGEEFLDDWQSWIFYILGFAICIVCGVLFVLLMPMCGCCYCCRHVCCSGDGCCCCSNEKKKKTGDCKRCTCSTLLIVMSVLMTAGVACVFITNGMLEDELSETGIVKDLSDSLDKIDGFLDDSMSEINSSLIHEFHFTKVEVFEVLETFPENSLNETVTTYGIEPLLADLEQSVNSFGNLSISLGQMNHSTLLLIDQTELLDQQLNTSRANIYLLLTNCTSNYTSCQEALADLDNLVTVASYEHLNVTVVGFTKKVVDTAISNNISDQVNNAINTYHDIIDTVMNQTSKETEDIKEIINDIEKEVLKYYSELNKRIGSIDFNTVHDALDDGQGYLDDYSPYYTWSIVGLTSLLSLIIVCNILGVFCGCCCSRPTAKDERLSCTSHQGANWLIAGVGFTFIFSWAFMLVTTLHFTVGGGAEVLVCRHLVPYDDTMEKIEDIVKLQYEIDYNISFKDTLEHCKKDATLYTASNAENNGYNITELLSLEQYGVYDIIDDLNKTTVDLGDVNFVSQELSDTVRNIDQLLNAIDYDAYEDELSKNVTSMDLLSYTKKLYDIAEEVNATNEDLAESITREADELTRIYNDSVQPIEAERAILGQAVATVKTFTHQANLSKLIDDLVEAEQELNASCGNLVVKLLMDLALDIIEDVENFTHNADKAIREEIAKCRPVFNAGRTMVYSTCFYFLEPFNSVWFCYGVFLFFSIPNVIAAACLASMFREPRSGDDRANVRVSQMELINRQSCYHTAEKVKHVKGQKQGGRNAKSGVYQNSLYMPSPDY